MRYLSTAIYYSCLFLAVSCGNRVIPLQSVYQNEPYSFSVGQSKDQVWESLIRELTSKGLAIVTIDKNSGLITTDKTSFINAYSFERKGNLTDSNALVVCTKVRGPFTFATSLRPTSITGQWSVLVKQEEEKTLVNITLANASGYVSVEDSNTSGQDVNREMHHLTVRSTGLFEKSIEKAVR